MHTNHPSLKSLAKTFIALGAVAALFSGGSARAADEKEACVTASDQAQTFRDALKFKKAREALLTCARDVCPGIVRKDCEKWLADLDASQPTVVVGARDAKGRDVAGVRVLIDGAVFLDHIEGKAVPIDPGEHLFRYESAGNAPFEERVVVRVGEKNRFLTVQLRALAATDAPVESAAPPVDNGSTTSPTPSSSEPLPVLPIVFVGVGVVAMTSFAYFGLTGRGDVSNLRDTCAPHCAQTDVDAAKSKLLIADVSLGISIVSLAAAAVWAFTRTTPTDAARASTGQLDFRALPGGGVASFGGRF